MQKVPGSRPGMGEGTDVKLFCYIDAVDPDYWLLRKKEEGQKGGECNGCETASLVSGVR